MFIEKDKLNGHELQVIEALEEATQDLGGKLVIWDENNLLHLFYEYGPRRFPIGRLNLRDAGREVLEHKTVRIEDKVLENALNNIPLLVQSLKQNIDRYEMTKGNTIEYF